MVTLVNCCMYPGPLNDQYQLISMRSSVGVGQRLNDELCCSLSFPILSLQECWDFFPFKNRYPNTNPAEPMINRIYATQNRNRTRPCLQSRTDMFRILKYDINSATEDCTHSQPLLLTRHNVVPGMFLVCCHNMLSTSPSHIQLYIKVQVYIH